VSAAHVGAGEQPSGGEYATTVQALSEMLCSLSTIDEPHRYEAHSESLRSHYTLSIRGLRLKRYVVDIRSF